MTDHASGAPLPPVTIKVTSGGYLLTCKALGVSCTAATLDEGYAALAEIAAASGQSPAEASLPDSEDIGANAGTKAGRSRATSSRPLLLIIAIALLPVAFLLASLLNDIRLIARDIRSITSAVVSAEDNPAALARYGSSRLARAAETISMVTPERQEEMRRNMEIIATKLAPVAQGMAPFFEAAGLAPKKDVLLERDSKTDGSPN